MTVLRKGYRFIDAPNWYCGKKHGNKVREHTVIMCLNMGVTEIPKGYAVHHIDGDKLNNTSLNLMLITHSRHSHIHQRSKTLSTHTKEKLSSKAKERWSDSIRAEQYRKALRSDSRREKIAAANRSRWACTKYKNRVSHSIKIARSTAESRAKSSKAIKERWSDPVKKAEMSLAMQGKRKVVECPHCGRQGGGGNMSRYHFDQCKQIKIAYG